MASRSRFTFDLEGTEGAAILLRGLDDLFDDMSEVFEGVIRPKPLRSLRVRMRGDLYSEFQRRAGTVEIVEEPWTLEGSVREAFENGGRNQYHRDRWEDLSSEPEYRGYKLALDAGDRMLIWDDADAPMYLTFIDPNDPDHHEVVDAEGFEWGSTRDYPRRLHEGGFFQEWDEVRPGPRRILPPPKEVGFRMAKGVQRAVVEMAKATGESPGEAVGRLRRFPRL